MVYEQKNIYTCRGEIKLEVIYSGLAEYTLKGFIDYV